MSKEERILKDQANLRRSLSRSIQTLRRTINANIGQWGKEKPKFMTLTFRENVLDHEIANAEFREFIKRLSYKLFKKQSGLKYTCVVERQARGAIHYHVLFYNLPYIKQEELVKVWENGKEQRGVRINAIEDIDNVGAYVVKYIEKDIQALKDGFDTKTGKSAKEKNKKLFFQSRGLIKPEERSMTEEELKEFESKLIDDKATVFEATHDNEFVGKMTYKQIKKRE
ncbi:rolling circle replication-associated protein [Pseudobacillus badius]|uniref:rolling circle replication-associated protein n=1 Tax=Bacillus badius TaxID=1455 RepID=UPI003D342F07